LIDILKKEIERKIGRKITNRGDCELVSNVILEIIDKDISYNTIRRFFGLLSYTKPNKKTLNTLCQFIGYKNYIHFTRNYQYKQKINLSHKIYEAVAEEDEGKLINLVTKTKNSSEDFISLTITLIRELLHDEDYVSINQLFQLKALNYGSFSYSEVLQLGNAIGLLLRKKNKIDPLLLNNINFLECIYLTFVDYSSLNKYYGNWCETIKNNNIRKDITLFSNALLEFKNFLNHKSVTEIDINFIYNNQLHPILCGRLLALKLLNANSNATLEILESHFKTVTKKGNLISNYYELFTTSILTKNLEMMKFLIDNLTLQVEFYYQKSHLNSFYLMCVYYYRLTGNQENESKFIKAFSLSECRHSYKEFITLMYLVYEFNMNTKSSEKNKIKNRYLKLSEKLNYSYFSEDYLLNYFN
jgi:hypothetical protein